MKKLSSKTIANGKCMREKRLNAGLSIVDMATKAGCNYDELILIESGYRKPKKWIIDLYNSLLKTNN